jgi:hypothetical protein
VVRSIIEPQSLQSGMKTSFTPRRKARVVGQDVDDNGPRSEAEGRDDSTFHLQPTYPCVSDIFEIADR